MNLEPIDVKKLAEYRSLEVASPAVKNALGQIVEQFERTTKATQERTSAENEQQALERDQQRMAQNMAPLEKTSPLYQKFAKKLGEHEDRLEELRPVIKQLKMREQEDTLRLRTLILAPVVE